MDQNRKTPADTGLPTEDPLVAEALERHIFAGFFDKTRVSRRIEQFVIGLFIAFLLAGIAYFTREEKAQPGMCHSHPEQGYSREQGQKTEPERAKKAFNDVYDI